MCCTGAKWKREVVQDHKFDFVDIHEYHTTGALSRLRYAFVYILVIKTVLVYISDIYTGIAMLANGYWSANILSESDESSTISVPFKIGKWIFVGCIIFSLLLLAWEARKARMIIRSRDISYAFTNLMANDYYCLKSYDHFCFFSQINNSKKKKDEIAFFVFFTFKGWKSLLLADAPRQVINSLTLYSFGKAFNFTTDISKYTNDGDGHFSLVRAGVLCTMIFTVVIFAGSAILLFIAALMYVPLLCYIQGNLKEYCCHKIDKRIAELMKRKTKKRIAREAELAKREAAGDFRHLQDKKGKFKDGARPLPQPTLPSIDLADEELYSKHNRDGKSDAGGSMRSYGRPTRKGTTNNNNNPYAQYPPVPPIPDLPYDGGAFDGDQKQQQQYPLYQLQDGQQGYPPQQGYGNYAYPPNSQTSLSLHHNDSFASFDDKESIRSRDPLIRSNSNHGVYGQYHAAGDNATLSVGGDHSQIFLGRAPSYKTNEDEMTYNPAGQQQNQRHDGAQYHHDDQTYRSYNDELDLGGYYEPEPEHPYAEPPYAMQDVDSHAHRHGGDEHRRSPAGGYRRDDGSGNQYPPSTRQQQQTYQHNSNRDLSGFSSQRSSSNATLTGMPSARLQQQQQQDDAAYLPTHGNIPSTTVTPPAAIPRGVSIAGRSEVSTFYYTEDQYHRDRASVADSHQGAFDLDDYARQSMFGGPGSGGSAPQGGGLHSQAQWQHQMEAQRGSRLEYLEEKEEEEDDDDDEVIRYRKRP